MRPSYRFANRSKQCLCDGHQSAKFRGGVGIMRFLAAGIACLDRLTLALRLCRTTSARCVPACRNDPETSVNETLVVTGADGLMCSVVDKNRSDNRPIYIYGLVLINFGEFKDAAGKASIEKLWPLAVGKSAEYIRPISDFQNDYWQAARFWTVTGKKSITVPAGTFDTYEISFEARNVGMNAGEKFLRRTTYYVLYRSRLSRKDRAHAHCRKYRGRTWNWFQ